MKEYHIIKMVEIGDGFECRTYVKPSREEAVNWLKEYADDVRNVAAETEEEIKVEDINLEHTFPWVRIDIGEDGYYQYSAQVEHIIKA